MNAVLKEAIELVPMSPVYREQVIACARIMHAQSIFASVPLDENLLIEQLSMSGGVSPDRYLRLAIRGEVLLGGFYGCVSHTYFSPRLIAKDLIWFIHPNYRGGRAAVMLLQDFERWAKERGALLCLIGQSTGVDVERTRKLYEYLGYRTVGYNTVKEL